MASGHQSIYMGSDEATHQDCDVCKYQNITSGAVSYCTVCGEHLCVPCDKAHRGSRFTRDHKILTGKDLLSAPAKQTLPIMFCDIHKSMSVNSFCKNHDEVICSTCKFTNHKNCTTSSLNQQASQMKIDGAFDYTMAHLTDLKAEYQALKQVRKDDKDKIKSEIQKCFADMQQTRKLINHTFDKLEQELSLQLKNTEDQFTQEIEDHIKIADDAIVQISSQIKSMAEYQSTLDDDVMFVGMKRANTCATEYDDIMMNMQQEAMPSGIRFMANSLITDVIQQVQSIGEISVVKNSKKNYSLLNTPYINEKAIDIRSPYVFGCVFMPDGRLVVGCGGDGLKLFGVNLGLMSHIPLQAGDVAMINNNEVIVTQAGQKQLQIVQVLPSLLVAMKNIQMQRRCAGVDCNENLIYVTCHDNPGYGEVQILNMDGLVRQILTGGQGEYAFTRPNAIKVSKDGMRIFVADESTHAVTCLDSKGNIMFRHRSMGLRSPTGMHVNVDYTLIVCGYNSHNVLAISKEGIVLKDLLHTDGKPLRVAYREKDGLLVLGVESETNKSLISFSMT